LDTFADELMDLTEDLLDPILTFMKGQQGAIYKQAQTFLNDQKHNLYYLDGDEGQQLQEILDNPSCFRGQQMNIVKNLIEILEDKLERKRKYFKDLYSSELDEMKNKLEGMEEYEKLSEAHKREIWTQFSNIESLLSTSDQIAMIKDQFSQFADAGYPSLVSKTQEWGSLQDPSPSYDPDNEAAADPPTGQVHKAVVPARNLKPQFSKVLLHDEQEVEEYLEALKQALLEELKKGNNIQV
jgi:hypothetical protein